MRVGRKPGGYMVHRLVKERGDTLVPLGPWKRRKSNLGVMRFQPGMFVITTYVRPGDERPADFEIFDTVHPNECSHANTRVLSASPRWERCMFPWKLSGEPVHIHAHGGAVVTRICLRCRATMSAETNRTTVWGPWEFPGTWNVLTVSGKSLLLSSREEAEAYASTRPGFVVAITPVKR